MAIADAIRSIVYFEGIAEPDVAYVADHAIPVSFSRGETIFIEGEPAAGLWLVETGSVKVFKLTSDGGEHILHLIGPGKTFNDIAALDGGPNPASAEALHAETRVWLLRSEVVRQALSHNPAVALNVIRLLAGRVRSLVGQIEDLALYSVVVRLARFLLKQAEDPSLAGPGITRTAIASHISTTPQTVSTVLHTLEEAGAITFTRQRITIVDMERLRSIALL